MGICTVFFICKDGRQADCFIDAHLPALLESPDPPLPSLRGLSACCLLQAVTRQAVSEVLQRSPDLLKQDESISEIIEADDFEEAEHTLCIDYSYWSTEHVLKVCPQKL